MKSTTAHQRRRAVTATAILITVLTLSALFSVALADNLYGTVNDAGGGANNSSTLVQLDPGSGAVIRTIGPVGYVVNGLTYDPVTDTLYGSTSAAAPGFTGLIRIDMDTGAGTPIGASNFGQIAASGPVVNLAADSGGALFGWTRNGDSLVAIEKTFGVATSIGNPIVNPSETGLAFDSADTLYLVGTENGLVFTVNTATGSLTPLGTLGTRAHHGDFNALNTYYGIDQTGGQAAPNPRNLVLANLATATVIATVPTVDNLHTVAFLPNRHRIPWNGVSENNFSTQNENFSSDIRIVGVDEESMRITQFTGDFGPDQAFTVALTTANGRPIFVNPPDWGAETTNIVHEFVLNVSSRSNIQGPIAMGSFLGFEFQDLTGPPPVLDHAKFDHGQGNDEFYTRARFTFTHPFSFTGLILRYQAPALFDRSFTQHTMNGSIYICSGGETTGPDASAVVTDPGQWVIYTNFQPDAMVAEGAGPGGVGDNLYNATASGQTRKLVSRKARKVKGTLTLQNDGTLPDIFQLRGTRGDKIFKVTYRSMAGANVTGAVTAGSYATTALDPGAVHPVSVRIDPKRKKVQKKKGQGGAGKTKWLTKKRTLNLTGTSLGDPASSDTARFKVKHR